MNEKGVYSKIFSITKISIVFFCIQRYGFNSLGMDSAHNRLSNRQNKPGIVSINLGKNKTTENAEDDYVKGVLKLGELADLLVINVSSPNTPGLRKMQGRKQLSQLIEKVRQTFFEVKQEKSFIGKIIFYHCIVCYFIDSFFLN